MDNTLYYALLLDFYGDLLTEFQRETFDGRYGQDLSLGEIAANQGVTRQSVNGTLRRVERLLLGYEAALGLVEADGKRQGAADKAMAIIDNAAHKCFGQDCITIDRKTLIELRGLIDTLKE